MTYSKYWNPKNETLPREELEGLQLLKLRRLCEWAYATTPFHQRHFDAAGFKPEQLKTLDDVRRVPFMTREEWMESLLEKPLFGDLLATEPTNAIRYHLTSGTTGRTPIRVLDIPGGAQTTEARIKQIVEMGVTTVCSTPTYALHLWQKAREMEIDLAKEG